VEAVAELPGMWPIPDSSAVFVQREYSVDPIINFNYDITQKIRNYYIVSRK
jgi:hypothetical protein